MRATNGGDILRLASLIVAGLLGLIGLGLMICNHGCTAPIMNVEKGAATTQVGSATQPAADVEVTVKEGAFKVVFEEGSLRGLADVDARPPEGSFDNFSRWLGIGGFVIAVAIALCLVGTVGWLVGWTFFPRPKWAQRRWPEKTT